MSESDTPLDVYKGIIDQLVDEIRLSGAASNVMEDGIYSNAPDHEIFNNFLVKLTPKDRGLIAKMLQEARDGAIHDVLAALTWWINACDVALTYKGEPMPTELSGMGLHGDYVGRRDGWDWPTET